MYVATRFSDYKLNECVTHQCDLLVVNIGYFMLCHFEIPPVSA